MENRYMNLRQGGKPLSQFSFLRKKGTYRISQISNTDAFKKSGLNNGRNAILKYEIAANHEATSYSKKAIMPFLFLFFVFVFANLFFPKVAIGQITQPIAWTKAYDQSAAAATGSSFAIASNPNRILIVGITANNISSGTVADPTVITYGGVTLTKATGNGGTSGRMHTWLYYLKDNAVMDNTSRPLNVTRGAGSAVNMTIWYTVFTGVDQAPASYTNGNGFNNSSSSGPALLSAAMAVNANEQAVYISSIFNDNSTTIPGYTINANWTSGGSSTGTDNNNNGSAWKNEPAKRSIPGSNTTDNAATSVITPSSQIRYTMSAMSLPRIIAPLLAITGTTSFGNACVGSSSSPITYTITNTGITANGITVNSNNPKFVVSGLSSTTIAGGGGTATYQVTFSPTASGPQNATITVASTTAGSNSPTTLISGTAFDYETPIVGIAVSPSSTICQNANATFTATVLGTGGGTVTYKFMVNGGTVQNNASNIYTTTTLSNGDVVSCDITVSGGCVTSTTASSGTITMTIMPPPTNISPTGTTAICSGTSTNISVPGSQTGVKYQLRNNVGNVNIGSPVAGNGGTINFSTGNLSSTTTYNIFATDTTTNCSQQLSPTITITVNPLPVNRTVAPSSSTVCFGTGTNITVASSTNSTTTYQLRNNFDNSLVGPAVIGNGGTINLPTGNLTSTTTFNVLATITATGCTAQMSVLPVISVIPVISNNTITANQTICSGATPSSLVGSTPTGGSGSYTYNWQQSTDSISFGNASGTRTGINYSPPALSQTTWYRRTVTSGACTDNSATVKITVNPLPAIVNVSGGGTVCANTTLTASNGGDGTIYFQGAVSGGTSTATPSTSQLINTSGTYYFRALSAAGCWGPQGSATVTINSPPVTTGVSICPGGSGSLSSSTICTGGSPTSVGPNNAGTGADDNTVGTGVWATPGNISVAGTPYATQNLASNATTHYLVATNYGFAIPAGATINGITMVINRQVASTSNMTDNSVKIVKGGTITGTNLASGSSWPNSFGTATYGGPANLWGTTWTPADINASNFGVAIAGTSTSGSTRQVDVDYIRITVTYTLPGSLNWYTVSSGGSSIGSGSSFNPVGVAGSGLANTNTPGTTAFYAECSSIPGCRAATNFVINALPNADAGTDKTLNCLVSSVMLNGSSSTTGVSFNWTTIGGNIVIGGNTATPTVNAAGTYILTVTKTSTGCSAKDTVIVNLNNTPPDVHAGTDKLLNCAIASVILNGSSSTGGAGFSWTTIGGNFVSGATSATPTVNAAGTYILTVTNPTNGCSKKDTTIVNMNNTLPDVHASVDSIINCYHTSVLLNGSSSTLHTSLNWTTTTGNIASGANTTNPTVIAGGDYYLTVTDSVNGCSASDTTTVLINTTPPNVNAGNDTTLTCTVTQVALNGSSTTPNAIFSWTASNGGVIFSGGNTANPLVQIPGTYILTVKNPVNGCTAQDSAVVFQNTISPNVDGGAGMTLTCSVNSVILNGSSSTSNTIYSWSTLDGNIVSGGTTLTPTVDAPGTYFLTVTDTINGCHSSDIATVNLNNTLPNVNAGLDTTLTCAVTSIILNGHSSTAATKYMWNTIGGNIASGSTTGSPTINATGSYILTVTDTVNGCSASDTLNVNINNIPPDITASVDSVINCYHSTVALVGNSQTLHSSYSWNTTAGNIISGGNTSIAEASLGGDYYLTVTDSINGCTATDTITVLMNIATPDANAGNDDTLTCTITQVTLNGSSTTPNAQFSWVATNGGVIFSGANTATPYVQIPGTYILTVKNPVNGCTAQDSANIYQNVASPDVDAGLGMTLNCTHPTVMLNASSTSPNITYSWITLDGNIVSGANTLTPTIDQPGSYFLTVTDNVNGCQSSDVTTVDLNNTHPQVNAGSDDMLTCLIHSVMLNGSSSTTGVNFHWTTSTGNILIGADTINPSVDAVGDYVLTVTDTTNGCSSSDTASVILNNTIPDLMVGNDTIINCTNPSVVISGSSNSANVSFNWNTTDGNIVSGNDSTSALVNFGGTYVLTVTDIINGCSASDSLIVNTDNTPPVVNAGNDTTLTCRVPQITLSGSAATTGVIYLWTTTNGNIVSGDTTLHPVINAAGTYTLTVTNPLSGCSAKDSVHVTSNNILPVADAGQDKILNCQVSMIPMLGYTPTSGAITFWTNLNGDTLSSGLFIITDSAGVYIFNVVDPNNGCSANDTVNVISDRVAPNVFAGSDTAIGCGVDSLMLHGTSVNNVSFSWNTIGGNIVSASDSSDININASGLYILTAVDLDNGCAAKDSLIVGINAPPIVDLGNDTTLIFCQGHFTLNAGNPGMTYLWNTTDTTQTINVVTGGTYYVTVSNGMGCSSSDTINLSITPGTVSVDLGNDTTVALCQGYLTLDAGNPGMTYLWNTMDTTQTINVTSTGIYYVHVTNAAGCSGNDTINVTVIPGTVFVDLGNDTTVVTCTGSLTLDAGNPGMNYQWSTGATTQTINVNAFGTYYVTVSNNAGCSGRDTINVAFNPNIVTVDLGNDTTFMNCHAPVFTLDAGNQGATYLWNNSATTQTLDVTTSGTYYVTVTDAGGCIGSDSININIINNNIVVDLGRDTTVCSCILLNAGHPGATYQWCSGQEYAIINACTTGDYCVTVSNGTCMDSDTVHVTIASPPIVNLGNDTTLVSGTLILDAGHPGATYLWSTGETTQTIVTNVTGDYFVIVTEGLGCTATDTIHVNLPIGINEIAASEMNISIYPNPTNDKSFTLSFDLKESSDVEINVMNILGKVIYTEKLNNFSGQYKKKIVLENVSEGIYFTNIITDHYKKTNKVIIE